MTAKRISIIVGLGALALSAPLFADDAPPTEPGRLSYEWREPYLRSQIGVGVTLGGGITGFTDSTMRALSSSDVGGLWALRVAIGTHTPLGLEVGYVGTATPLQTFGRSDNGNLIGTTAEGVLRYNAMPHAPVTPFLFGGLGWQHYDVSGGSFVTGDTGMLTSDDVLEVPMGVGIGFRDRSGLIGDLRGTYRWVDTSNLVTDGNGNHPDLHTWEASAELGYEF